MSISVEQLSKIYKVNKGADVCALKNISFNLPDTGMVFILGKSGCGKSTLLNVLGGLDGFDSGDVKIDGKSIKDYKAKDLDGYRNDYVGFVFQENNLLEKESVHRNVALALDLQSIKDKDGKVAAALESVGLKEFEERKCNRLSGGQKQRVAIARALIKEPKLLLCDEPTGALDSETGEDIFTLLKELSSKRLVMVVSHDRESAEKYGDRVIELKDGGVISDSAPLGEVAATDQSKKKHGGLRFSRAFTTGLGYIIARPVRMAICLLLCLFTFTLVGVADTVYAYDRSRAMMYTMDEMNYKYYEFGKVTAKNEVDLGIEYEFYNPQMSVAEADELSSLLDVDRHDYIYDLGWQAGILQGGVYRKLPEDFITYPQYFKTYNMIDYSKVKGFVEADESFLADYGYSLLAGRLPENTNEVAIPLYLFNFFKVCGYITDSGTVAVNTYDDLIGKTVSLNSLKPQAHTVTGIVDTRFGYQKQADILFNGAPFYGDLEHMTSPDADFRADMLGIKLDAIHNTLFVCKGFKDYFEKTFGFYNEDCVVMRVIAPYKGSNRQKQNNIGIFDTQFHGKPIEDNEQAKCYHLVNYCAKLVGDTEQPFLIIQTYAIYVVVMAVVICVLFLTYYASGTISEKRREIGILRALGASRWDISKIFGCEHSVFTAVAVAISSVIGAVVAGYLDNSFVNLGLPVTFIKFGFRQFAVVAAIAILAVAVGVAFPLIKLLHSKPVDVIADRK